MVELSTIQLRATFTVEYTSLAKIVMLGPAEAGVCVVAVERRDQPVFVYIIMYIFISIYLYIYVFESDLFPNMVVLAGHGPNLVFPAGK